MCCQCPSLFMFVSFLKLLSSLSAVISYCLCMPAWSNFSFFFVFLPTSSLTLQMSCERRIHLISIVIQIVLEQCEENGLILCSFWLKPGVFFPKINYMGVSGLFREFFFLFCIIAAFWVVENPLKAESVDVLGVKNDWSAVFIWHSSCPSPACTCADGVLRVWLRSSWHMYVVLTVLCQVWWSGTHLPFFRHVLQNWTQSQPLLSLIDVFWG